MERVERREEQVRGVFFNIRRYEETFIDLSE
jgi:hypothetical protein